MTEQKTLSVIVPVYKVEPYLARCLDSIMRQNVQGMEVLIVDDGSPDNSYAIMERYAARWPQTIRIFQKPNGGLSDARNFGLDRAEGEYIAFVDSDDYILDGMYEQMLRHARKGNFDLVVCDLEYVYGDRKVQAYSHIDADVMGEEAVRRSMTHIYPAAWNKLYKRSLFSDGLRYKKGVWFEDVELLYRMFPKIRSIGTVHKPFYQYVQREGAITSVYDERQFDYLCNLEGIIADYIRRGIFDYFELELQYCCARYAYATFMKGAARTRNWSLYWRGYREAKVLLHAHFGSIVRNRYFWINGFKGLYLLTFGRFTAFLLFAVSQNSSPGNIATEDINIDEEAKTHTEQHT